MDWNKAREQRPAFAGLRGKTPEAAFGQLTTPCYILDKAALRRNGEILKGVQDRTGCRILLGQIRWKKCARWRTTSCSILPGS